MKTMTVKEFGGWERFSVSDNTLCLTKQIAGILGIPFKIGPESGWAKRYFNVPLSVTNLETAHRIAESTKRTNNHRYHIKNDTSAEHTLNSFL